MKKVYIISRYRAKTKRQQDFNTVVAQFFARETVLSGKMPIVPHIYFTQFLDDEDEDERECGLWLGIHALRQCDEFLLVVIDGKIAYTGGVNLADEYINEKKMYGYWKDSGIKIEGPCVDTFTLGFLRQWEFVSKKPQEYSTYLNKADDFVNSAIVIPYLDGLDYPHPIAKNTYVNMMSHANKKLFIMTPYFIPDETITDILKIKAESGVDVRIVLPEIPDKKLVYLVTRSNAEKLLPFGVKIYTMKNSFVHSKVVLTEYSAVVGSVNVDQRSFNQQFESAVYSTDSNLLDSINSDFEDIFANCNEITPKNQKRNSLLNRIFVGFFRIISPFM